MFLALWYYLQGYVMIEVSGFSVERFVNMATFRGIYVWNMHPKGSGIQMCVSQKGLGLLEECTEKTGCRYEILEYRGLPAMLRKYRKRKVLAVGLLFFVGILYGLSSFVWVVEVEGNERIPREEIVTACAEMGLSPSKWKGGIDTERITEGLLEQFSDIAWVSVRIEGTDAQIHIVETIEKPEIIDQSTPRDLVAKKDSVIQSITAEAGTPMVQMGDVVKAGEVLISGEIVLAVGEEPETGREYLRARGSILGKVWYTFEEAVPLQYTERIYTDVVKKDKSLLIGDSVWNAIRPNTEDGFYEKEQTGGQQLAIGDFQLPVGWIEETYRQYEEVEKTRTEEEAKAALEQSLRQKAEETVEGDIADIAITYEAKGDTIVGKATITALEEIGEEKNMKEEL